MDEYLHLPSTEVKITSKARYKILNFSAPYKTVKILDKEKDKQLILDAFKDFAEKELKSLQERILEDFQTLENLKRIIEKPEEYYMHVFGLENPYIAVILLEIPTINPITHKVQVSNNFIGSTGYYEMVLYPFGNDVELRDSKCTIITREKALGIIRPLSTKSFLLLTYRIYNGYKDENYVEFVENLDGSDLLTEFYRRILEIGRLKTQIILHKTKEPFVWEITHENVESYRIIKKFVVNVSISIPDLIYYLLTWSNKCVISQMGCKYYATFDIALQNKRVVLQGDDDLITLDFM